ncbi:hypothetical protein C8J57DRAFT_726402 [Mycena rebaudengoi]|nr:hypothetical protein C8J57DRAFT_726402 [Mycena rebaudengoi]
MHPLSLLLSAAILSVAAVEAAHDSHNLSHSRRGLAVRQRAARLHRGEPRALGDDDDDGGLLGGLASGLADSLSKLADGLSESSQSVSLIEPTSTSLPNSEESGSAAPDSSKSASVPQDSSPAENSSAPAENSSAPPENSSAPPENSAPTENSSAPESTSTTTTDKDILHLSSILSDILDPITNTNTPSAPFSETTAFSASNVISDGVTITPPPPESTGVSASAPVSDPASDPASQPPVSDPPNSDPFSIPPISIPPISIPPISIPLSIPPISLPPISDPPISDPPISLPPISLPPISLPPISEPPVSQSQSASGPVISDPPVSQPPVSDPPVSQPPISDPPVSQPPVSDPPVSQSASVPVSAPPDFPSGPSNPVSVSITTAAPSGTTSAANPGNSDVTVPSDLSFILAESSLAVASQPPTESLSLTDPDQPTTTVSLATTIQTGSAETELPKGLPWRIYPASSVATNPGDDYTFISLLFDGYLDWEFVCTSPVSSTQLFAMMPAVLASALGLSTSQVITYALQVRIPATYTGVQDIDMLQTTYLAYLPSNVVDTLALQLKSKNSAFYHYNGPNADVGLALTSHIVAAFALNSVVDPNSIGGENNAGNNQQSNAKAASAQSKTRQDAIIGVVSTLGVIAVLVLVFLAFRAFRRRAELAHRRLSDPPQMHDVAGARPDGREFDQDSLGGQRRRSFYFAEDSLRGFQGERPADDGAYDSRAPGMMQRRNVMPAAISAPILQQSSMNW